MYLLYFDHVYSYNQQELLYSTSHEENISEMLVGVELDSYSCFDSNLLDVCTVIFTSLQCHYISMSDLLRIICCIKKRGRGA